MNPHYHPYGGPTELTSPHPPSPDNNNYHGHGGGPQVMHLANGHSIGSIGLQNGLLHNHHQHPAFTNSGVAMSDRSHHPGHYQNAASIANNNNNNNNPVKVCAGCKGTINERYLLQAMELYWHNSCLKCSVCNAMLAEMGSSCYTKEGLILCKQDYMRMYGASGACSACGQTIPANELVMRAGGGSGNPSGPLRTFHVRCFMCSKCMNPLLQGDRYYIVSERLVCESDWHKLLKTSVAAPTVRKGKVGRPRRSRD